MAQFTSNFQNFKPSYPFLEIDPNLELVNQFQGMSHSFLGNPNLNFQSFMPFSNDSILSTQTHDFPGNLSEDFSGIVNDNISNQQTAPVTRPPIPVGNIEFNESKKRKAMTLSESTSENCSPQVSESGIDRKNSSRKGKRVKSNEKEEEKSKEVVHVRARRGQATDSHSLAERVRRGKINERLKCLQDIVPGCYKTMGMAVMLDEIINYVQSLQNQVEFLSMKLTAASSYYDFNSETDVLETMQSAKANEAKSMETLMREGYGGFACFHSNWSL